MPRSPETVVDPAILTWARATSGLSVEEAAARIATKPERVADWENGEGAPSMAQLRKMAAIYKRLLSDFYLPAVPQEEPLPHDFRRMPGQVALTYSRALRVQLRQARERRQHDLDRLHPGVRRLVNPHIYHVSLTAAMKHRQRELVRAALGKAG